MSHKKSAAGLVIILGLFLALGISGCGKGSDDDGGPPQAMPNYNFNDYVSTVVVAADGATYIGGNFTLVSLGTTSYVRHYLAKLDSTGKLASWDPSMDGPVSSIAVSGNTVYAGGFFTNVNTSTTPKTRNNLAAFDASTGQATSWNPSVNLTVNALAMSPSGTTVYAGGSFQTVNTNVTSTTRNFIAAFDAVSGHATAWNPDVSSVVNALAIDGNIVYAGGGFATVNAGSKTRFNLAAFDATTGTASSWDPSPGSVVYALAVSGNTVYAGGGFTQVNGSVRRNSLASFNTTTGLVTDWDPYPSAAVNALAISGSTVYAGGVFTKVNNGAATRNNLASFDTTTGLAASWDPNANSVVSALAVQGSYIFAGGNFTSIGTDSRGYFARIKR